MTIYDIAEKAGVSASTVSRVINNRPGIKASTRERVSRILAESSFSISENARGLVNRNSMMIGILISDIRNQHYSEGAYFMIQEFLSAGYCPIILNAGESTDTRSDAIRMLSRRKVDGVVMIGSTFSTEGVRDDICRYLSDTPVVMENGQLDLPNVSSALADDRKGIVRAVEHLHSKGRRRFVYINANDTPSNRLKIDGFISALRSFSLEGRVVEAASDSPSDAGAAMARILDECTPDAVIGSVDLVAIGAMREIISRSLRVPEDIAVFGVDNSIYSELAVPALSSVDNRLSELSSITASMLLDSIGGKGRESRIQDPALVIRESTP